MVGGDGTELGVGEGDDLGSHLRSGGGSGEEFGGCGARFGEADRVPAGVLHGRGVGCEVLPNANQLWLDNAFTKNVPRLPAGSIPPQCSLRR